LTAFGSSTCFTLAHDGWLRRWARGVCSAARETPFAATVGGGGGGAATGD
jgi:hypothetical protein